MRRRQCRHTHLVVGACIGALVFDHNYAAVVACTTGAVAPDTVMIPPFIVDKLRGWQPLAQQGPLLLLLKNLSHSVPLWMILCIVGWYTHPLIFALAIGGLSHPLIDMFTHGNPELNEQDSRYFWPVQKNPWNIGTWDYRYRPGDLWPIKPLEKIVLVVCVVGIVYGLIY